MSLVVPRSTLFFPAFFFSRRRRHTRFLPVSWARRCVYETASGLGGIFLKDMELGFISSINSLSINEVEVLITLKVNPLEETFYGIMSKEADEI